MFKPFQTGIESCQVGDLTLENQTDQVSLYGNLQLHQDQLSLQQAMQLRDLMQAVIAHLQSQSHLPVCYVAPTAHWVDNPFQDQ